MYYLKEVTLILQFSRAFSCRVLYKILRPENLGRHIRDKRPGLCAVRRRELSAQAITAQDGGVRTVGALAGGTLCSRLRIPRRSLETAPLRCSPNTAHAQRTLTGHRKRSSPGLDVGGYGGKGKTRCPFSGRPASGGPSPASSPGFRWLRIRLRPSASGGFRSGFVLPRLPVASRPASSLGFRWLRVRLRPSPACRRARRAPSPSTRDVALWRARPCPNFPFLKGHQLYGLRALPGDSS